MSPIADEMMAALGFYPMDDQLTPDERLVIERLVAMTPARMERVFAEVRRRLRE